MGLERISVNKQYYETLVKFREVANKNIDLLNQQNTILKGINDALKNENNDLKKKVESYEKIFIALISDAFKKANNKDSVDVDTDNLSQEEII